MCGIMVQNTHVLMWGMEGSCISLKLFALTVDGSYDSVRDAILGYSVSACISIKQHFRVCVWGSHVVLLRLYFMCLCFMICGQPALKEKSCADT